MNKKKSAEEQQLDAQTFLEFYIELMENPKSFFKYHLSENVILDWFGRTIKGQKAVTAFIKTEVNPIKHFFKAAKSTEKIGYRDSHFVKAIRPTRRILRSSLVNAQHISLMITPKKMPQPSTSAKRAVAPPKLGLPKKSPQSPWNNSPEIQTKRQKMTPTQHESSDIDILECENNISDVMVKYLISEGEIEFHRPSFKKLQKETIWRRGCKLHLAYDTVNDIKDSIFYLIIYEGNVKCRRNLMKDFEAEEPET